jgi:hypothetical protein
VAVVIDFVPALMSVAEFIVLYLGLVNAVSAAAGGYEADAQAPLGAALLAMWGVVFL